MPSVYTRDPVDGVSVCPVYTLGAISAISVPSVHCQCTIFFFHCQIQGIGQQKKFHLNKMGGSKDGPLPPEGHKKIEN